MIEVLKEFKASKFFNTCKFLYNTEDNNKIELLEELEKDIMQNHINEYYNNINNYGEIQKYNGIKQFLFHFYYELIHSYNGNNTNYIYYVLKQMKQYYRDFHTFELKTYRSKIKKLPDDKLQELSNKLFNYYFLNKLKNYNLEYFFIGNFKYFFPLKFPKVSKVLFECFEENFSNLNTKLRNSLFKEIIQYNKDDDFDKILDNFAKRNTLEEVYKRAKELPKIEDTEEIQKLNKQIRKQ